MGCGWLGLPLAKTLAASGFSIKGSTTSAQKMEVLSDAGVLPYSIELQPDSINGDIAGFLDTSAILILDIPPKVREQDGSYPAKIETLIPYIEQSGIRQVLFISSTSVYGKGHGTASEDDTPKPETDSGRQIVQAENLLRQNSIFETTILRFGGLIGDERHPVRHLAGKKDIDNPEGPVNLIHRDDCLNIILKIIENKIWGETFNAVAPYHPSREAYYTQKAASLGLELPEFNKKSSVSGKIVSPGKLLRYIKYNFMHPEL